VAIKTVDIEKISNSAANIYEAITIAAKRARQLHTEMRIEFEQRKATLEQITGVTETEEEVETAANPDQLKISLEFETRPKPTEVAMQETTDRKLDWRYKVVEDPAAPKGDA
jgi:DNA-directed RNA polymerase subunit K/omega